MSKLMRLTQNQVREAVKLAIQANLPIMVYGSGGIGKSNIVSSIANEMCYEFIDLRLSQMSKLDLGGYPVVQDGKMKYLPLSNIPLETDPLPKGKKGWILMLDELLQADKYTQGASFRIILDRQVGEYNIHPNVRIVCASNGSQNSAADNKMVAPLKSRLIHVTMEVAVKEFQDYVEEQVTLGKWSPLMLGFIKFSPQHINDYNADKINEVETYSCPRTLEYLNDLVMNGLLDKPEKLRDTLAIGTIGLTAGHDFNSYVKLYSNLPTVTEIVQDPLNCRLPESTGAQWALSAFLLSNINSQTANPFVLYIERIPNDDIKVIIYRTLVKKYPAIIQDPNVAKSLNIIRAKLNQATNP